MSKSNNVDHNSDNDIHDGEPMIKIDAVKRIMFYGVLKTVLSSRMKMKLDSSLTVVYI